MSSYWRNKAREVIAKAIADGHVTRGLSGAALAAFVGERYPFAPGDARCRRIFREESRKQLDALKPRRAALAGGATPLFDREGS